MRLPAVQWRQILQAAGCRSAELRPWTKCPERRQPPSHWPPRGSCCRQRFPLLENRIMWPPEFVMAEPLRSGRSLTRVSSLQCDLLRRYGARHLAHNLLDKKLVLMTKTKYALTSTPHRKPFTTKYLEINFCTNFVEQIPTEINTSTLLVDLFIA